MSRSVESPESTFPRDPPFHSVACVGLGLMGGSLVRAVREAWPDVAIHGVDLDPETRTSAHSEGIVDSVSDSGSKIPEATELLVFATHTTVTVELFETVASRTPVRTVVTDLSSLKRPTLEAARSFGFADRYVGSHPITGGEFSGFGASHGHLYRDAPVWLVADLSVPTSVRARMERFWTGLGSPVTWADSDSHDTEMIPASHVPQLVANALARVLEEGGLERLQLGPGGQDMTRLAGSGPDMWVEIFEWVGPELASWLERVSDEVGAFAERCRAGEFETIRQRMEETRRWKERSE